jgi:hypothetical protein
MMQGILEDRMYTPAEVSFSGMSPTGFYTLQSMLKNTLEKIQESLLLS